MKHYHTLLPNPYLGEKVKLWIEKIWIDLVRHCTVGFMPTTKRLLENSQVSSICVYSMFYGENVYQAIFCPSYTLCLGMLLELPFAVVSQMLQDEAMLTAAVDKALGALQEAKEPR